MTTLRNKLIEQILMLAQEADIEIGNGWDYTITLDRRCVEFVLNQNLPELSELLAEYDKQISSNQCIGFNKIKLDE